jgi:hypothetical protein
MGIIKKIHRHGKTSKNYQFQNYTAMELTENVHFHYRNQRLEFTPQEFLFLKKMFDSLTPADVERIINHKYGHKEAPVFLRIRNDLPYNTWWANTFMLEELVNGTWHFHFGNLRIDLLKEDVKRIFGTK